MKLSPARTRTVQAMERRGALVLGSLVMVVAACILAPKAFAQEAPDVTIKRAVGEVTAAINADKEIQAGNRQKIAALVDARVVPFLNVQNMTRAAVGRHWAQATPEQQQALMRQFSRLLINTYSGALSSYRPDTTIEYRPLRMQEGDNDAVVRSLVKSKGGEAIQLDYYVERADGAWKVVDFNVLGARLVETYKNQFNGVVATDGIDGLIKALAAKNQAFEARGKS